jgi:hypothetical protein
VLRERDVIAGPCLVLPRPFQRFAEQRRVRLAENREFGWLVERIRSGPPRGFFRIGWVRSFPNLNVSSSTTRTCAERTTEAPAAPSRPHWRRRYGETSAEVVAT